MGKILENLNLTLLVGIFIAVALMMAPYYAPATIAIGLLQWLHVFFGVMWIGLLYYFNANIETRPPIPPTCRLFDPPIALPRLAIPAPIDWTRSGNQAFRLVERLAAFFPRLCETFESPIRLGHTRSHTAVDVEHAVRDVLQFDSRQLERIRPLIEQRDFLSSRSPRPSFSALGR